MDNVLDIQTEEVETDRRAADDVLFFYVIWSKAIIYEASSKLTFP